MPRRVHDAERHIILFYSNTGGGHRAATEAVREELESRYPHVPVIMEDFLLRGTFWPFTESDRFYAWSVERVPWLWKTLYEVTSHPFVFRPLVRATGVVLLPRLRRFYAQYRPRLVVALHPLLTTLPLEALRSWEDGKAPRVPFATVMTDLTTFHPSWLEPRVDVLTVPTREAYERAVALGFPEEKIRVLGLPVRRAFRHLPQDRRAVRRELDLQPDRPVVLLTGGGQGMGPVEPIAVHIARRVREAQLVIISGRNERLRRRLEARSWPLPVRVLGFVHDMHLWMSASDVLVSKAGPGTIAEALICGLPILLYGYVPGQEEGNVEFVEKHGIGAYRPRPEDLARELVTWLSDPQRYLEPMRARARALAFPRATEDVVDTLIALIPEPWRPLPTG